MTTMTETLTIPATELDPKFADGRNNLDEALDARASADARDVVATGPGTAGTTELTELCDRSFGAPAEERAQMAVNYYAGDAMALARRCVAHQDALMFLNLKLGAPPMSDWEPAALALELVRQAHAASAPNRDEAAAFAQVVEAKWDDLAEAARWERLAREAGRATIRLAEAMGAPEAVKEHSDSGSWAEFADAVIAEATTRRDEQLADAALEAHGDTRRELARVQQSLQGAIDALQSISIWTIIVGGRFDAGSVSANEVVEEIINEVGAETSREAERWRAELQPLWDILVPAAKLKGRESISLMVTAAKLLTESPRAAMLKLVHDMVGRTLGPDAEAMHTTAESVARLVEALATLDKIETAGGR